MTLKESTDKLQAIDLFISDKENIYADVSILSDSIYYCFATEDSREDGRITADESLLASIGKFIAQCPETNETATNLEIKMRLTFTSGDVTKCEHSLNHLAKKIITELASRYDDFLFLTFFDKML